LSVTGLIEAGRQMWARRGSAQRLLQRGRRNVVLAAWTLATLAGLLAVPVPAQRYYLPLVPIVCLWAAEGAAALARPLRAGWRPGRSPAPTPGE
jgi:hypothetical protein